MPCFGPLNGYRPKTGKKLVFDVRKSLDGLLIKVPCGRCTGCRLERVRQWAMRCMHEKRMHSMSSFLTLTYDDDHLPLGQTLVLDDLQRFMKRLRKVTGNGLRFYACGEYGELNLRPHYHVLLFNYDFDDKSRISLLAKSGNALYTSKVLSGLWTDGFSCVGDVSFDSCAYVARYVMKKRMGEPNGERSCRFTGIVALPEFTVMSRRPGLGTGYLEKYGDELLIHDSVVFSGREMRPPRFYDAKLALRDPVRMDAIKVERSRNIKPSENTTKRLRVREVCAEAALSLKGRSL